ncbi:hypothetical protein [Actinoplanes regularis]|uniref:hypothetical protein n=1 Tax=Actinoplanes regularis TaxID=52697 RepID=UPI0024A5BB3A|nr:hypothetical protein [Actinoplanes regularis]GLW33306.1 hypothetical protein Areg01_62440 [Actinoplanes regularis]
MARASRDEIKKMLNIKNFRELGVRHAEQLVEMMPDMDKEVRLKVVEQLPEVVRFAVEAMLSLQRAHESAIESGDKSRQQVNQTCRDAIAAYAEQLRRDDLDPETRRGLNEGLERLVAVECEADVSHKRFLSGAFDKKILGVGAVLLVVWAVVGGRAVIRSGGAPA